MPVLFSITENYQLGGFIRSLTLHSVFKCSKLTSNSLSASPKKVLCEFMYLTKLLDLVSREGLLKFLLKISC